MELHQLDLVIIFQSEHGVCKSFGGERFADTRCSLQDYILLLHQQSDKAVIGLGVHIDLTKEIVFSVELFLLDYRDSIAFSNNVKYQLIFDFRQTEERALWIAQELHFF